MRILDKAVKKIGHDIERLKFNTAIAELMSLANWFRKNHEQMSAHQWERARRTIVLLLAPFEPFMAEVWQQIGGSYSVHGQSWPHFDEASSMNSGKKCPFKLTES